MGLIICEKHGAQGFYEVCEHLNEAFDQGVVPPHTTLGPLDIKVCTNCAEKYHNSEVDKFTVDEILAMEENKASILENKIFYQYEQIQRSIICCKCFEEKVEKTKKN